MKKIFVDTNILLDLLTRREPYFKEAERLFSLADRKKIELSISALTVANVSYILMKYLEAGKVREILRKIRLLVKILPLDDKIIDLALNDENFKDFEDALQYYTALENRQDLIISRNVKDYKAAAIPVMPAHEFLQMVQNQ